MIKNYITSFLVLFVSFYSTAQTHQWAKRLAGSSSFDVQVNDIVVDQNVYVGGSFTGTVDFDLGTGISNRTANGTDGFVAKYDHGGNLIWVYTSNASGNQTVRSLNLNTKINVATKVSTNGLQMIALEPISGLVYATSTLYSANSTITVNGFGKNTVSDLYVVGSYAGNWNFGNNVSLTNLGGSDAFLVRFNQGSTPSTHFTLAYAQSYGGTGNDEAFDISLYQASLRMVGSFEDIADFDPSPSNTINLTSAGLKDGFVIELNNANGRPNSASNIFKIGSTGDDAVTSIDGVNASAIFAIGGYFTGTVDFDPNVATSISLTSAGSRDGFVSRYLFASGITAGWAQKLGGSNADEVTDVSINLNANNYIYYAVKNGSTSGSAVSIGAFNLGGTTVTFGGLFFPSNQTTLNTANVIYAYQPSASGNQDVYTGGIFNARTDFDPSAATDTIGAITGGNNGFIQKMSSCSTATTPTILATLDSVCSGVATTLSIGTGGLNGNANWVWYSGSCGGTQVGTGPVVVVNPTATTNYFVRGQGGCAATSGACSLVKQIKVITAQTPVLTIATPQTTICAGTSITFTSSSTYVGTNTSYVWRKNNQVIAGASAANYTTTTAQNGDVFTCTITTTNNCGNVITDGSNTITITVSTTTAVTSSISAPSNSVCQFSSILFTATTNATTATYQWLRNGVSISGATASTYNANAVILGSNVTISCVVTTTQSCFSPSSATSSTLSISVTPSVTPNVSLVASSTTVCPNGGIQFDATATNGGSSPTYNFTRNGTSVQSGSSSVYVGAGFTNGTVVRCILASNAVCPSPAVDTSNSITVTVSQPAPYVISLSASQTAVCSGNSVTFTSSTNYTCPNINYQWFKNGVQISGAGQSTYSTSAIANNDQFTVRVNTTNAVCGGQCLANFIDTSNVVTMSVSGSVVPSVSIATPNTSVCAGANVTFTATPTNGGTTPTYQWRKNGNNINGANAATYTTNTIANNDVISCVLTSSVSCASPTTATSNSLTMQVTPAFVPSVNISGTTDTFCELSSITYVANAIGTVSSYQWTINGVNAPLGNSIAFTPVSINDKDTVRCVITSSETCANPLQATSNAKVVTKLPALPVSVDIATNQNNTCAGSTVIFTSNATNGGSNPSYKWFVNGNQVAGQTASSFSTSSLTNNAQVYCKITSNIDCPLIPEVTSDTITISVVNSLVASVSITASDTDFCDGDLIEFNATSTNGGSFPVYEWSINGIAISAGSISPTITLPNLNDNDTVTCLFISSESCVTQSNVSSSPIIVTVNELPNATINVAGNVLSAEPSDSYQWYDCANNSAIFGENNSSYTVNVNGDYKVVVTSQAGCSDTSICVNVSFVASKDITLTQLYISPNPFFNEVKISINSIVENMQVEVFSIDGKSIIKKQIESNNEILPLDYLSNGVYYLRIKGNDFIHLQKIVKQ